MQNVDKGLSRIIPAGRGHMLITLWASLISNYVHNAVLLARYSIEIIIDNKNYVALNNLNFCRNPKKSLIVC